MSATIEFYDVIYLARRIREMEPVDAGDLARELFGHRSISYLMAAMELNKLIEESK